MALTDANGKVKFEVPPGNYRVGPVQHAGYNLAPAQEVMNLADGETRQVKFQLVKPLGFIEISVVDSVGNPLVGVDVPLAEG